MKRGRGSVVLVGAGPGDPDLLTLRAARELRLADVLLYDALLHPAILALANPDALQIDVGKRGDGSKGFPQDRITELMVEHARAGRRVVRLKGGDPFVFGRGGEEASALAAAGVPFEVVPGVSSAVAVPAYAGIPVTDRRTGASLAVISGHRGGQGVDWEGLARAADTLVILMGTRWLPEIVARVIGCGRDPGTPAAVIARGTTGRQRVVTAPLRELPSRVQAAGLTSPTVIVIGEVARFRESLAWFEARPLFGRRVLVLRARPEGAELVSLLAGRGAEPIWVPLLELGPPEDAAAVQRRLARADEDDWLLFTSANAVRFAAPHLPASVREGRAPTKIACVGEATAAAARAAELPVALVPARARGGAELARALSEVATSPARATRPPRVLFASSDLARPALREGLARHGIALETLVVYRNLEPVDARAELLRALEPGVDAVLLTSPSAVSRLVDCLGAPAFLDLAKRAVLACIGPTTAAALRDQGAEPALVAESPGAAALVAALERHGVPRDQ